MKRTFYPRGVLAAGLVLLVAALSACSRTKGLSATAAVAVIGQDTIKAEIITRAFEKNRHLFKNAEEELAQKQTFLNLLVEERLLIQEAYRQKIDRDSSIKLYEALQGPLFLIDHLYFREVQDKVRLTPDDVARLYDALKQDRCLKKILVKDRTQADDLLRRLRQGENFDSLARRFSKDQVSGMRGGDAGCFGWNQRIPQHFEEVLKMKPGNLAGPFGLPEGWLLLYCYEQRPAVLPERTLIEKELRGLIEGEREIRRSAQFVREVRGELNYRIVDSTARLANLLQKELSKVETPGQPLRYSVRLRTEELSESERNMPLLTYDGGVFTLGQYLEQLQGSFAEIRPALDTTETTRALFFQLIFRNAMEKAALQRKLDQDPDYLRTMRQAVEGQMALRMKSRILAGFRLDSSAAKTYFDAHPDEFIQPEAFHLLEINRSGERELLHLKPELKSKPDFSSAASQLTARQQLRPSGGDLGWVEKFQFPELFEAASKLKVGQIAGPVKLLDGSFSLIYLDEKRPARKQKFAELKDRLYDNLLAQKEDSVFRAWMTERKQKTKISLFPETLEKTLDYERYARLREEEAKKAGGRS